MTYIHSERANPSAFAKAAARQAGHHTSKAGSRAIAPATTGPSQPEKRHDGLFHWAVSVEPSQARDCFRLCPAERSPAGGPLANE